MNQLPGISNEILNHIAIFKDGSNMIISDVQATVILKLSAEGKMKGVKIKGQYISFDHIAKILTSEEFFNQYPKNNFESQSYKQEFKSLDDITAKYQWAVIAYKFSQMKELVLKTFSQMNKFEKPSQFINFCIKNNAITDDGKIICAKYLDEKGKERSAIFAYPFLCDIWNFTQEQKRKREYAQQINWENIKSVNDLGSVSYKDIIENVTDKKHIQVMITGFKKTNENINHQLLKFMELKLRTV